MKKIIKNGTIATDSHIFQSDILIEDGIIREIGESLSAPDAEILDASGKYVIPGAVDVHTHMDPVSYTHLFFPDGKIRLYIYFLQTVQRHHVKFTHRFIIFRRISRRYNDPALRYRLISKCFAL